MKKGTPSGPRWQRAPFRASPGAPFLVRPHGQSPGPLSPHGLRLTPGGQSLRESLLIGPGPSQAFSFPFFLLVLVCFSVLEAPFLRNQTRSKRTGVPSPRPRNTRRTSSFLLQTENNVKISAPIRLHSVTPNMNHGRFRVRCAHTCSPVWTSE